MKTANVAVNEPTERFVSQRNHALKPLGVNNRRIPADRPKAAPKAAKVLSGPPMLPLIPEPCPTSEDIQSAPASDLGADVLPGPSLLSGTEREQLAECERIVEAKLADVFEVGSALLTIKENHLYRATHATFESYCRERWGFGRSYAWRVTGAAERVNLLPADESLPRPANEFQVRPFMKLTPEEFPKAWKETVSSAGAGKITGKLIRKVVARLTAENGPAPPAAKSGQRKKPQSRIPQGQILVLLQDARKGIETSDKERALSALERIEQLLF